MAEFVQLVAARSVEPGGALTVACPQCGIVSDKFAVDAGDPVVCCPTHETAFYPERTITFAECGHVLFVLSDGRALVP